MTWSHSDLKSKIKDMES